MATPPRATVPQPAPTPSETLLPPPSIHRRRPFHEGRDGHRRAPRRVPDSDRILVRCPAQPGSREFAPPDCAGTGPFRKTRRSAPGPNNGPSTQLKCARRQNRRDPFRHRENAYPRSAVALMTYGKGSASLRSTTLQKIPTLHPMKTSLTGDSSPGTTAASPEQSTPSCHGPAASDDKRSCAQKQGAHAPAIRRCRGSLTVCCLKTALMTALLAFAAFLLAILAAGTAMLAGTWPPPLRPSQHPA
jgi:hypothetical protein